MSFTVRFHGTGNAWPEVCDDPTCPLCAGADRPLDGRGNTSFSIVDSQGPSPSFHILIDIGQGACQGMRRSGLSLPDVILLSHGHPDHLNTMELDTVVAMARQKGSPHIPVVCTERTWDRVPGHIQKQLRHWPIKPNDDMPIRAGTSDVIVHAFDASSHFKGAVAYSVKMQDDLRVGAFCDLKDWASVLGPDLECLDLAVIDANTLCPKSAQTGHLSIAENIAFLSTLTKLPRLVLFTHYAHDDATLYSQGSLTSLLQGIAPGLPIRMAYKGMTISSDLLPPRSPVAILDDSTNLVVGVREKSEVHATGALHASVLILVKIRAGEIVV
jgi:hypothetical protein